MDRSGIDRRTVLAGLLAATVIAAAPLPALAQGDPLPSWNDGPARQAITEFLARVTRESGPDFVPPAERVTTFDNDGSP